MLGCFGGFRLSFGFVDRPVRVIGRGIQSVQFHLPGFGCVDDVVPGARWDNDATTFSDNVFLLAIEDEFCFPFFDPEELIDLFVYLVADFLAFLQAHHNQLGMFAGKQHLAEIMVLFSQFFDGSNETGHMLLLLI
jgi:hypothetical protein